MNRQSAQSFTASKVSALYRCNDLEPSLNVLNALRHQRFRHKRERLTYLVQFRAQRHTASKVSALVSSGDEAASVMCSTPYGIKGFGTWPE